MKKTVLFLLAFFMVAGLYAGNVQKTFTFGNPTFTRTGSWDKISFEGTTLSGIPGEPALPYQTVSLLLPPGEKAISIEITGNDEQFLQGKYLLFPQQYPLPLSRADEAKFVKNEKVYQTNALYPVTQAGHLLTSYLNGYAFALSTFTPVKYNPVTGQISYYASVTINIKTQSDAASIEAMKNLTAAPEAMQRVRAFAQDPAMMASYPAKKSAATAYKMLIITPAGFQNGFNDLTAYYVTTGVTSQIVTTEDINATGTGQDLPEKIRNYIIQQYQDNNIEYVLLGGDIEHVPYRGLYCYVTSGSGYEDYNIPADIYYASLDGNWNTNGDLKWGEPGEDDPLPEISVARFPFSTSSELSHMVHKTITYQQSPVLGELKRPYLVGENLYDDPLTFGSDYLELLVNNHSENGYSTFGIPSQDNDLIRLYDSLVSPPNNYYQWTTQKVLQGINDGKSFIHHVGHSNETYMMRLFVTDITDANFSQVNGIAHNYTLMYTHGCICGAFDYNDCIAEKALTISNFLVGGVFNSRYGWFNQGTSDGPSEHLHREFISAMYNDTMPEKHLGTAHTISKIRTAPFITLPGEFEPGAQRWCMYDCNAFGDPSLLVWTDEPSGVGVSNNNRGIPCSVYPVPARESVTLQYELPSPTPVTITLSDILGHEVQRFDFPTQQTGKHVLSINLTHFLSGSYVCRIETLGNTTLRKIMIIR